MCCDDHLHFTPDFNSQLSLLDLHSQTCQTDHVGLVLVYINSRMRSGATYQQSLQHEHIQYQFTLKQLLVMTGVQTVSIWAFTPGRPPREKLIPKNNPAKITGHFTPENSHTDISQTSPLKSYLPWKISPKRQLRVRADGLLVYVHWLPWRTYIPGRHTRQWIFLAQ